MAYRIAVNGNPTVSVVLEPTGEYGVGMSDPVLFPKAADATSALVAIARKCPEFVFDLVDAEQEAKSPGRHRIMFGYKGDGVARSLIVEKDWVAKNGQHCIKGRDIQRGLQKCYHVNECQGLTEVKS